MSKPVLLIGGGGHAKVLLEILRKQNANILGIVAPQPVGNSLLFNGLEQYFSDDDVFNFDVAEILLVNGIGSLPGNSLRHAVYEKFTQAGYEFSSVISSDALVSKYCNTSAGVQIMPGAIVNADAEIGANTIINSGAVIEHDCKIGMHNHVAPGAVMSGNVCTADHVHIGTGACVIQSIHIGKNTTIGAGASINRDVGDDSICYAPRSINRMEK